MLYIYNEKTACVLPQAARKRAMKDDKPLFLHLYLLQNY